MQNYIWKLLMGLIVVFTVCYLAFFMKVVVEYMKETSLDLTIFCPL